MRQGVPGYGGSVASSAYPWRESSRKDSARYDEGETGPGSSSVADRRSAQELAAQYNKLKESGLPLDTMKLMLNEDLSALSEDAGHILKNNERLGRYALYVSNLERTNKELGVKMENLMAESTRIKADHESEKEEWSAERSQMQQKLVMADMQVAEAKQRQEQLEGDMKELKEGPGGVKDLKDRAAALEDQNKALADGVDELRDLCKENGIAVPKHLSPQALGAAGKREAAIKQFGPGFERVADAATSNADAARISLRVSALQSKGIEPPVDEAVMDEMLGESLTADELKALTSSVNSHAIEALAARGIAPKTFGHQVGDLVRSHCTAEERSGLHAACLAREAEALASRGVRPPIDPSAISKALSRALSPTELEALYAHDMALRQQMLNTKGAPMKGGASETPAAVEKALKKALSPAELESLEATVVAGHLKVLAERSVLVPHDEEAFKALLTKTLGAQEVASLHEQCLADKVKMLREKKVSIPADEAALLEQLKQALSPEEYEEVTGRMRHEKMTALASKGRQVPVDEVRLLQQLESTLSPRELEALKGAEHEAAYNASRAAIRMEKLLEKGVPLSDELVIACQRGEAWAIAELDRLVQLNFSNEEIDELLNVEEAALKLIFGDEMGEDGLGPIPSDWPPGAKDRGDGYPVGSYMGPDGQMYGPDGKVVTRRMLTGGGGGGRKGSGRGPMGDGLVDKRSADIEHQSLVLDLQTRLESDYLTRLADANGKLRQALQGDLDKEMTARREAQARNLALIDAVESQRARNAELMAKLAEHEARELERLRQLESMQNNRELELEAFRLQAERAIQDAAEAKAAREQLERAINQYEKILDVMGVNRAFDKDGRLNSSVAMGGDGGGGYGMPSTGAYGSGEGDGQGGSGSGSGQRWDMSDPRIPPGGSIGPNGEILDANGNPVLGPDGRPLIVRPAGGWDPNDPRIPPGGSIGPNGEILDAYGNPVLGPDGSPLMARPAAGWDRNDPRIPPGGSIGPNGEILDTNGNPVLGPDGRPLIVRAAPGGGASGYYDANGNWIPTGGAGGMSNLSLAPAVPPHLLQLEKFVLLTDEGAVAVRARLNGTVGYLKQQIATQLHISPRLALSISSSAATFPLQDDAIIAPFAEGRGAERLLLSAAPRPLSDFFPGAANLPAFHQVRIRPMVRGVPQNFAVVLRGATEETTTREIQTILSRHPSLLPVVSGKSPERLALYFSPVFITPDVLLGRKGKQLLKPNMTLGQAQCIDDDILYLAVD